MCISKKGFSFSFIRSFRSFRLLESGWQTFKSGIDSVCFFILSINFGCDFKSNVICSYNNVLKSNLFISSAQRHIVQIYLAECKKKKVREKENYEQSSLHATNNWYENERELNWVEQKISRDEIPFIFSTVQTSSFFFSLIFSIHSIYSLFSHSRIAFVCCTMMSAKLSLMDFVTRA